MFKPLSILLILGILTGSTSLAAATDSTAVMAEDSTLILSLPPLDSLFVWAEANSPAIHEQLALIDKTSADANHIKKIWMDAVKLSSTIQDGNFGDPLANKLSLGYSTGVSISFSLYQVLGLKNLLKVYKAERNVASTKKEQSEFDTKKEVIILYNNIIAQRNILRIQNEAALAAYTHMKMAEKEFKEGGVAVGELSRVTEIYTKSQVDYQVGYNVLKNNYMELELMIGRPLNDH